MTLKQRYAAAALAAITALTLSATFDTADARVRRGQASVHTERGNATARSEVRRERGTRTRDATITGANGRQRNVHDERTRGDNTYTHDRVTTYSDGSQRTVDTDVLRTGQGAYSASREVTGRNGETRVQTGEFNRTRTEDGRTLTGGINTSNHGQIDYQRDVSRQDGVRSVNSSATFEDGTAITRSSSRSCADGSCSSSGVVTARNGNQTTWDQSRTRTENGAVLSRDVTYADGTTRGVDRERAGNGDGTGTITRTVTGRDGETRTQTGEYEVERTP